MSLPKILNGIHASGDILGNALIPDDISVFTPNGITAEQAMEKAAVLFSEFGFKILYKSIAVDLPLKHLPMHGVVVYPFGRPHRHQIFFAHIPQKVHCGLVYILERAVFIGNEDHVL